MDIQKAKAALSSYQYKSDCASPMYPIFKRVWYYQVLRFIPRMVHPNVITAFGLTFGLLGFLSCLLFTSNPQLVILPLVVGICFWMYNTMDNVDGPQARRTGMSSPLGEMFDHSVDAFMIALIPLGMMQLLGVSWHFTLISTAVAALAGWASMWEVHHRGVLVTGKLDDTTGLFIACCLMGATGILGMDFVRAPLFGSLPSIVDIIAATALFGFGWQLVTCVWRQKDVMLRLDLLKMAIPQALLFTWFVLADGAISGLAIGLLMCLIGARKNIDAIVTRLYGDPHSAFDKLGYALPLIGLVLALVAPLDAVQTFFAWAAIVSLIALHVLRMRRDMDAICSLLNIRPFTMPRSVGEQPQGLVTG